MSIGFSNIYVIERNSNTMVRMGRIGYLFAHQSTGPSDINSVDNFVEKLFKNNWFQLLTKGA